MTSTCPAGTVILGGGATYSVAPVGQHNRVVLLQSYPSAANAWTVTYRVVTAFGAAATLTASSYAVCTV